MQENLNDYFPNPFEYLTHKMEDPFEIIENKSDIDFLETNIVVDYFLFIHRIMYHPFLSIEEMVRNKEKVLYLTMFTNLPQYELTFNRTKEFESKGSYNVKKYYPYLNFELKLVHRDKFADENIKNKYKDLRYEFPQTNYVVSIVYPKIVKFMLKFNFAKKDQKELDILKTGLQRVSDFYGKLFGNPTLYPKFVKEGCVYSLKYPSLVGSYLLDEVLEDMQ